MRRLTLLPPPSREKDRLDEARERQELVGYVDQKEFEAGSERARWRVLVDALLLR
jgi:hypothetical protein